MLTHTRKLTTTSLTHSLKLLRLTSPVSSKKFHQIAEHMDKNDIIHPVFEDNLLSKFIQNTNSQKQNYTTTTTNKSNVNNTSAVTQRRVNYKQLLEQSPRGSILTKEYKGSQLCLTGMNYTHTSYQNLYKSITKFQPDCILVQNRPQIFCHQFQPIKKNPQTNIFSDRLYIQQLQVDKGCNLVKAINKTTNKEQLIKKINQKIFPKRLTNKSIQSHTLIANLQKDLLNEKPLLSSLYYSSKQPTDIFLSSLPEIIHHQFLANSNTLMELQQLFSITSKALPLYPGLKITPYQLASFMFPETFLPTNDNYMAVLVEVMLALGYKRIMLFSGVVQNQAVWEILENNLHCDQQGNIQPLIQCLMPPQIKGNLIRDHDILETIQKHILLDTLYYGTELKHVPLTQFTTTNKIINHYAKNQPPEMIFKFRYEMSLKYSEMLQQCLKQGQERKRKQWTRKAIRE